MTEEVFEKSRPVVDALAAIENVRGILCFGSQATGQADEHSDVDLFVLCDPEIAPPEDRAECLGTISNVGGLEIGHLEPGWANQWNPSMDRFILRGITFDLVYNTVDWTRAVVRGVTEQGATSLLEHSFRPYCTLAMLESSIVLYDPELILQELRSRLYPYPARLKADLLAQGRTELAGYMADLKDYAARDIGSTAFHFILCRILDTMGTVLYALNERYDPGTKRVEKAFADLTRVPTNFLQRYERILETPLTPEGRRQIAEGLGALVSELEGLIAG